jgi:hypothetical protein
MNFMLLIEIGYMLYNCYDAMREMVRENKNG